MNKYIEQIKQNWLLCLIVAQPFLDIIAYFQQDNVVGSLAGYSRLLVMIVLPIYVLCTTKKKKSFIALMSVIAIYSICHILNIYRVGYISLFQDVAYLMRVIQMPVLAISLIYCFHDDRYREQTMKAFVINAVVIFVTMCIAHLSGTAEYTYEGYNFGMLGWFANANAQSIIIISLIPIVLFYALYKKNIWLITGASLFSVFLLLSNGTKAAYYSTYLIFGGYAFFLAFQWIVKRKKHKKLLFPVILLFLFICVGSNLVYPLTPRYQMDNYAETRRDDEQEDIDKELNERNINVDTKLEDLLADPVEKQKLIDYYGPKLNEDMVARFGLEEVLSEYGWWPNSNLLADMRFKKQIYAKLIWNESDLLTKMFGFEYTQIHGFDLENDYPAIFYYYGYVGFGLYILFIAYFVLLILRKMIEDFNGILTKTNFALLLTLCIQLGLAQFSGAILRRPNVSIYLSIILALIYYQCTKKRIK